MNEKTILPAGDAEEIFPRFDEQSAHQQLSLKHAGLSLAWTGPVILKCGRQYPPSSFQRLRALSRLQPPLTAARLTRLVGGVKKAIENGAPERYERARWLEEAVAQLARGHPTDADSQELQRCLTRLLRQSFRSLDWRRPFIAALRPVRVHI